jgi:signal transduction histidine kinase
VVVSYGTDALELAVTNPIAVNGPVRTGGGHGIPGMRERAALLGGRLEAGGHDGRFRVRASLPYGGAER